MTVARIVWWKIKSGKRDEAIARMDGMKNELNSIDGFRGLISLESMNNPDRITNISFWDSEETLNASQNTILKKVTNSLSDILDGQPQVANQSVHTFDVAKIMA